MFEPRRYFEGADRRRRISDNLEILCSPAFEEIFTKLFGGLGDRMEKPRVYSIRVPERNKDDVAQAKKLRDDFHWKIEDDEEPVKEPPSIFEMLAGGKKFSDIVPSQPKHTEIYNQAFGLDDNGNPIPLPEDDELDDEEDEEPYIHEPDVVYAEDEDDEEDDEVKDPYVFIANRLTFLIQTKLPIIFDTSTIETGIHAKVNYMSIAVNVDKTFPKIETENDLAFIMREFNGSEEIQGEINEFLKDTEYDGIWAFPSTIVRNDVKIPAIRFVIYPKRKYYSFGPAFLNRNK